MKREHSSALTLMWTVVVKYMTGTGVWHGDDQLCVDA